MAKFLGTCSPIPEDFTSPTQQPLVSVVVLNRNGFGVLVNCIESLLRTSYNSYEIILVDNGSTDGSLEHVEGLFSDSRLKMVRNNENLGFAEGNNVGFRASNGNVVVFLSNDVEVDPNWLDDIVGVLRNPATGACQSKILLFERRTHLDCAGGLLDRLGFVSHRGELTEDTGQYDVADEIFHARGAAMAVKRSVLQEVGLFDPRFFIIYEEVDLCWRIRLGGYKVLLAPKSKVYHMGGFTMARSAPAYRQFHAVKNHIAMLLKNYAFWNLVRFVPVVIFFRLGETFGLVLKGRLGMATSEAKSMLWVLANARYLWSQRLLIQRVVRAVPDSIVMKKMLRPTPQKLPARLVGKVDW